MPGDHVTLIALDPFAFKPNVHHAARYWKDLFGLIGRIMSTHAPRVLVRTTQANYCHPHTHTLSVNRVDHRCQRVLSYSRSS